MTKTYLPPIQSFLNAITPHKMRSMVEWAEAELILPTGVRKGERLNYDFAPYTKLIIEQLESKKYRRFWLGGSVQSGKTLVCFILPVLYHLFEMREDVIVLLPTTDMAQSIWNDKILPVIMMNPRLKEHLPTTGQGSKAGKNTNVIRFTNGAQLRFLGAGGGDSQRSSHTARVIVVSEADKMDVSSSDETDPLRQAEARSASFGGRARLYAECTLSTEQGRLYQESNVIGTGTRVFIKCPHCMKYIFPEREQFKGWENAENVIEAQEQAYYECQNCETHWTEADRREAQKHPKLIHKGQSITDTNEIEGEEPATNTFGLLYNAFVSPLLTMADIAEKMWRAKQCDTIDARKEITQFVWSEPWEDENLAVASLEQDRLINNFGTHSYGDVIKEGDFTIAAIDCQHEWIWLLVERWSYDLTSWVSYFNSVPILPREQQHQNIQITPAQVLSALNRAKDIASSYGAESLWVDISYKHADSESHIIRQWAMSEAGVHGVMGRADSSFNRMSGKRQALRLSGVENDAIQARTQESGEIIHFVNTDVIKDELFSRLQRPLGQAGCKYLPKDLLPKHKYYLKHMTSEKRTIKTLNNGTEKREWKKMSSRHNDLFDCSVYSLAGAMLRKTINVPKPLENATATRKQTAQYRPPRPAKVGHGF